MRLVSGMRAHTRPRFAAVLRTEDTGRARAARGEAADRGQQITRGEQIRGEIDAQSIKVAPTDELADEQAKLVEVEGQKIALFRVDGGFKCAGSWGARMRPSQLNRPHGSLMPGLTMQKAVGRVYVRVTSLTLVADCSVQGEHEQCENSWSPYW